MGGKFFDFEQHRQSALDIARAPMESRRSKIEEAIEKRGGKPLRKSSTTRSLLGMPSEETLGGSSSLGRG
jgi:hypothetical protein